ACEEMRNRERARMALQISVGAVSAVADVIVPNGVMPGRGLRFQLLEDLFDAILTGNRFVVEELELRHPPEPEPLAQVPSQEGRRPLERFRALALCLLVAKRRVIDPRELE